MRYVLVKLVQASVALVILSAITFALARASGSPLHMLLPPEAPAEEYARVTRQLRLDEPYHVQYATFLANALRGDLGVSIRAKEPVMDLIRERLPHSIALASVAMVMALLMGIPLGVLAAVKRGSRIDGAVRVFATLGQSLPLFWIGIVLIEIFAVRLEWLPVSGADGPLAYILPALTLACFVQAGITRLQRSSMLEVLDAEFIKLARIKGVSETMVIWKHALRNALIPVFTFSGMYFAILITLAVVVEVVFSWPGIGRLVYEGIYNRDYPVVQGVVLVGAALVILINVVVDVLFGFLDPRIKRERS